MCVSPLTARYSVVWEIAWQWLSLWHGVWLDTGLMIARENLAYGYSQGAFTISIGG